MTVGDDCYCTPGMVHPTFHHDGAAELWDLIMSNLANDIQRPLDTAVFKGGAR